MENNEIKTLEEIRKLIKPVDNVNLLMQRKLSRMDKVALWITENVGSMGFFIIIFVWTFAWLGWNTLMPGACRFDPYPAFVLWLFLSNMIQILLMPLIMVGQNLQSDHAEIRADADFEVNKISEMENETIIMHLENQNKMLQQLLEHLQKNDKAS